MILVLIGYMGSGKSTIGKALAKSLSYRFLDLDDYISEQESASVSEIFKTKGEIYFRKKEMTHLKAILNAEEDTVLALGGGTPCYGNNMSIITESDNVKSFYLKLSIPNLVTRLSKEKDHRPLISHLQTKEDLTEFIGKHLFERSAYYSEADHVLVTDHKTPQEIIEAIETQLI
ncbi:MULTISPECIES: shikimate kinase [Winogradskyella]|uniref:Shikimate kinase n=2 Tax=Winogradskyella TaxID=286104 RepID=A0A368ZFT8_9FLAO|nr:shikimate kinase [Winogradskyella arenosi]RCW91203.1 shikimate kinase [Winogradskyella arenosi]